MPTGRPSKYEGEATIALAAEYIENFAEHGDTIPQTDGLAKALGVCVKTLYNWGEAHEEFLQMLDACMARQRRELINKGLDSTFNAAITKLVLTKHGYHDKTDNTLASPTGGPVEWTILPVTPADAPDSSS